jgi:hypothetical protein
MRLCVAWEPMQGQMNRVHVVHYVVFCNILLGCMPALAANFLPCQAPWQKSACSLSCQPKLTTCLATPLRTRQQLVVALQVLLRLPNLLLHSGCVLLQCAASPVP